MSEECGSDDIKVNITEGEVLAVTPGTNDATGMPILVLTIRPDTNSGFKTINLSIRPDNGVILAEKLQIALRHDVVRGQFRMPQSISSLEAQDEYENEVE